MLLTKAKKVKSMGITHVPVTLRLTRRSRKKFTANFLADSGATDSFAPGDELRRAGILPEGRVDCELADGSLHEYDFAVVHIELLGTATGGRVIFGPDGCEPLLGVTVMESIGAILDPGQQKLKLAPAIRLK